MIMSIRHTKRVKAPLRVEHDTTTQKHRKRRKKETTTLTKREHEASGKPPENGEKSSTTGSDQIREGVPQGTRGRVAGGNYEWIAHLQGTRKLLHKGKIKYARTKTSTRNLWGVERGSTGGRDRGGFMRHEHINSATDTGYPVPGT